MIGAEALIRWQHPERGLLPPAAFLHYLEGSDLEIPIGEWVIESALCQLKTWQDQGLSFVVSVNISARHLLHPDFADRLKEMLAAHPEIPTSNLELEILETAALSDVEQATRVLSACHDLGVRFSLDDFGTGYSSLTYFRTLPVDVLKIDQSFVRNMFDNPNDLEIVESVIKLSRAFNRQVIAEGVETFEHGALLSLLGCRICQGYGISPPMPAESMLDWVSEWSSQRGGINLELQSDREDIPLMVAAERHQQWIKDLVSALNESDMTKLPQMDKDLCDFGRWYEGPGDERYGALMEFRAIAPVHDKIHMLAEDIRAGIARGDVAAAKDLLPELYARRDELLHLLYGLIGKIKVMSSPDEA